MRSLLTDCWSMLVWATSSGSETFGDWRGIVSYFNLYYLMEESEGEK